jgi:hypothetical protein
MVIENTQDLILVIGSACGAITAILTICYKMSRCEYVNICKGFFIIKRDIKENKKIENSAPGLTPNNSLNSIDDASLNV